ncbi:MAG: glycosyltransferase [Actinomycetota bacterium]|nr:glycosyltransferase [Actinomycetota bacterium]
MAAPLKVAAIIPAHNEAATVADVVRVAGGCRYVDEVIVVDSLSDDQTTGIAAEAGARVVAATSPGKGEAMAAGVAATDAEVLLFLDADLLGLRVEHLDRLVTAVTEEKAAMSCGLFDRGPVLNPIFLKFLPILTGERALVRELFESLGPDDTEGYKIEAALNSQCGELGWKRVSFVCPGLWHLTKEKKYRNPVEGFIRKTLMLLTAAWEYFAYRLRRRKRAKEKAVAPPRQIR